MYISLTTILFIAFLAGVGGVVGALMAGEEGLLPGIVVGAILAMAITAFHQQSEISSWEYEDANRIITGDCRMTGMGESMLSDRVIRRFELWRLRDREKEIELTDARSKINGERLRECPAVR